MTASPSEEAVHILLVEDNPGDIRLTQEAFNSIDREIKFHVVRDGEAAVKYAHHHLTGESDSRPDIILLDLNLPRIDGFGVLEILNEELESPPPPVLILSGSAAADDINKCYSKGCNAYLTKPDDMGEFATMARSIKDFWLNWVRSPSPQS